MDDGSAPDEARGQAEEMRPDAHPLRILMAGEGYWPWYQGACGEALRSLGHSVRDFGWFGYFSVKPDDRAEAVPISRSARVQNRLKWGPRMSSLNRALIEEAVAFGPDVLFVYNGTHVFRETLVEIKARRPDTFLVQYCNDNPFGRGSSRLLWRHLIRAIPVYDLHFVYRHQNVGDFRGTGARAVELLRSYYIPEANRRMTLAPQDSRFVCDVVFAGHYEDDGRVKYLEAICGAGHKLNLFGGGWGDALRRLDPSSPLRALYPIRPAVGEDYLKALCGARIALCFLSRLNRDTYTRRNFEIPATGTFMMSEYTEDLASLFEEGREAEFFRSRAELMDKIAYYLRHDDEREAIARRGRERLIRDGHDVTSRMRQAVRRIRAQKARSPIAPYIGKGDGVKDSPACMTLNILSDLATPHNNSLIRALSSAPGLRVNLYYAMSHWEGLPWKEGLHDAVGKAEIFGEKRVNLRLLWRALSRRREKYLLVGWANPTIRAILVAFWALRRPFMFWSDHPDEGRPRPLLKALVRRCFFHVVKARASHVFAVGRHTVRYFEGRGFPPERLINLPIFIEVGRRPEDLPARRREGRSRYGVLDHEVLYVAASRFVYAKGFDLLIRAAALIDGALLSRFRLLLIGHGPEEPALQRLISEHGLEGRVMIEGWMAPEQFEVTVAAADVFVHPARFDAFGGGTLHAMAAGVPVIGSDGAGTALERVEHGVNGLIFRNENIRELAERLTFFLEHPEAISRMGVRARETAEEWPPERGARILLEAVRG